LTGTAIRLWSAPHSGDPGHGQADDRDDQIGQHRRHRLLLCDEKNPRTSTEKFEFKKYDPIAKKHVAFKESKIK